MEARATDLDEDLVVGAEYNSETEFLHVDLDTFTHDLLDDDDDWTLRAVQTHIGLLCVISPHPNPI